MEVLEETQPAEGAQIALKLAEEIRDLRRIAVVEYATDVPTSEARKVEAEGCIEVIKQAGWSTLPKTLDDLQPFAEFAYFQSSVPRI